MRRPFIFTSLGVVRGESKRGNRKCGPENSYCHYLFAFVCLRLFVRSVQKNMVVNRWERAVLWAFRLFCLLLDAVLSVCVPIWAISWDYGTFLLRKLILHRRMRSHPLGLDVWFLVGPFVYFHTLWVRTAKALARLAWAFAGCLCDKYHNLMSWLIWCLGQNVEFDSIGSIAFSSSLNFCILQIVLGNTDEELFSVYIVKNLIGTLIAWWIIYLLVSVLCYRQ